MNNGSSWQEGNARYLAATLAWLRACMEQFAARQQEKPIPAMLPAAQPAEESRSIWRRFGRSPELPQRTSNLLLTGSSTRDDADVANAAAAFCPLEM